MRESKLRRVTNIIAFLISVFWLQPCLILGTELFQLDAVWAGQVMHHIGHGNSRGLTAQVCGTQDAVCSSIS